MVRRRSVLSAALAATIMLSGCAGTTVNGTVPTASAPPARTPTPRATSPSPTPEEQRIFVPGPDEIQVRMQEGEARVAVRRYSWQRTANGVDAAPPRNSYLVLDVTVTATAGKVQVNPVYFTARDEAGQQLDPVLGADGNEPVLVSTELTAPDSAEGLVTFDAPGGEVVVIVADELGNQVGQIPIPRP